MIQVLNGLYYLPNKTKQQNKQNKTTTSRLEVLTLIIFRCLTVNFLADLYGETTFTIEGNGKMKTVTLNRTQFLLSEEALSLKKIKAWLTTLN